MYRSRSFLKNSRKVSSVAALGLSALLLVSCGGDDDEDTTPTVAPVTEATEAPVEDTAEEIVASPTASAGAGASTPLTEIASPAASPVTAGATPVGAGATPVGAGVPVVPAATPEVSAATPQVAATPLTIVASPVASLDASPVASPAS